MNHPISRRSVFGLTLAGLATGAVVVTESAKADPVDPSLAEGETRILDVDLSSVEEIIQDGPSGEARRIGDVKATMVGCTWTGEAPEDCYARGQLADGAWTEWFEMCQAFNPDNGLAADGTNPIWLDNVYAIDVAVKTKAGTPDVTGVTAHVVTTTPKSGDEVAPRIGNAPQAQSRAAEQELSSPNRPGMVNRAKWGANESLVKGVDRADELKTITVHHTEGSNNYTAAQSAQQVRGILTYHTQSQGWSDIGYNFLVDKYGQIFEGRHGGVEYNIVGAHAYGFNTGSCGISMLGSYMSTEPTEDSLNAVVAVAYWKLLNSMHADVNETVRWKVTVSNTPNANGSTITLPRIYGHRNVNYTDCPGDRLYAKLGTIRQRTQDAINRGWRLHLDAFNNAGGTNTLGTVTFLAHPEGRYQVTKTTKGIVLSEGDNNPQGYVTPFKDDWSPEWGRPTAAPTMREGFNYQHFEYGTAWGGHGFTKNRFTDVPATLQFANEINDLANRGIVTGYPDGSYRPLTEVGRDALIAFVYRAKGSPAFTAPAASPFRDMTPSTMYYKEVCWAKSMGIVEGWPDGTFRPTASIDRQSLAAFLYRASNATATATSSRFSDVPAKSQFAKEITWMSARGLAEGYPDGTFRPNGAVLRDAMAAFLLRWINNGMR